MRKITLVFLLILAFAGFSMAQTIEDFESITLVPDGNKTLTSNTSLMVVPNPFPGRINNSRNVVKFVRDKDDHPWLAILGWLGTPISVSGKIHLKVKVWKPKINTMYIGMFNRSIWPEQYTSPQTITNEWELIDTDFEFDANGNKVKGRFDILELNLAMDETLTQDMIMYFDDIFIYNSPVSDNSSQVYGEDFENIPLNLILGNENDSSRMSLVPNPDPTGVNVSSYVIRYDRDRDGIPGGGFSSLLPEGIDQNINKYMHVLVRKPRISPLKFKVESSELGALEVESLYSQSKTNEWEDIVFDLSANTGLYSTIAFMPDAEDPLTLTQDEVIYFDDIVVNNDPMPRKPATQVINYDLNGFGLGTNDLYVGGVLSNSNYSWSNQYGTIPGNKMSDPDGDGIYSVTLHLPNGPIQPEFHFGTAQTGYQDLSSNLGTYNVSGDFIINYQKGRNGYYVSNGKLYDMMINVDMSKAELAAGEKVYISGSFPGVYRKWAIPGTNSDNELHDGDGDSIYSISMKLPQGDYSFKVYKGSGWLGAEWNGWPNRSFFLREGAELNFTWGTLTNLDDCNLIKDGHFETDQNVGPFLQSYNWGGELSNGDASIKNGVLTMKPDIITSEYGVKVFQLGNVADWGVYNDSSYIIMFDAWADNERPFSFDFEDRAERNWNRYGISADNDSRSGLCEWDIQLTKNKTTYVRTVTFNAIKEDSYYTLCFFAGADTSTVYIDNVFLIKQGDISKSGILASSITISGDGGANTIETDDGTLQMNAKLLPENVWIKGITWTIRNGSGKAIIDANGLLKAFTDGNVTVKASTTDGSNISDSLEITISNQVKLGFPITFESFADMGWDIFANGASFTSDFSIVSNPNKTPKNESDKVLKFIVNNNADPWVGAYSEAYVPVEFSDSSYLITMTVLKSLKSPTGIKVEHSTNGGPDKEVKVAGIYSTKWQLLTFDFSDCIGYSYPRITIYPDYPDVRKAGTTVYIDNINLVEFGTGISTQNVFNLKVFPNPVVNELNVSLLIANAKVAIYNSLGLKMEEIVVKGKEARFDVSNYPKGLYFVKDDNGSVVKFFK